MRTKPALGLHTVKEALLAPCASAGGPEHIPQITCDHVQISLSDQTAVGTSTVVATISVGWCNAKATSASTS